MDGSGSAEDVATGDLGGAQDLMRKPPRPDTTRHRTQKKMHPLDGQHGLGGVSSHYPYALDERDEEQHNG